MSWDRHRKSGHSSQRYRPPPTGTSEEHQVHRSETAGEAGGGAARRSYRIHYQTAGGDGHLILPHGPGVAADIVAHAEALLQQRGISARIRRIVPVTS
jgi:hypothetical protein